MQFKNVPTRTRNIRPDRFRVKTAENIYAKTTARGSRPELCAKAMIDGLAGSVGGWSLEGSLPTLIVDVLNGVDPT
jgi:hypothetical protein